MLYNKVNNVIFKMSYEVQKYLVNSVRLGYDTFITSFTNNKVVGFIYLSIYHFCEHDKAVTARKTLKILKVNNSVTLQLTH